MVPGYIPYTVQCSAATSNKAGLLTCHDYRQRGNGHQHRTREDTLPRRESRGERRGPAIGLDHANRRQPSARNCSYSSRVSPQAHQRKTRNCGLAHLRREAATKHEGRVCKVGVREGWPCVGYTPPLCTCSMWWYLQRTMYYCVLLHVGYLPGLAV